MRFWAHGHRDRSEGNCRDGMSVTIGGGLESISLVQNDKMNRYRAQDPWLVEHCDDLYMSMLETAEIVAERYRSTRQRQDEYAPRSQQRTAAAQSRWPVRGRRSRPWPP
jgi:acetyl-CoA C-acetyltransferase